MNSPIVASRMNAFVTSDDDATTRSDGQSRRPVPRYPSNSDLSLNSRMSHSASALAMANAKPAPQTQRKSSARDYKAPLGPRPLHSSSNRVVSDAPPLGPSSQSRSLLPTSTSDTLLASSSRRRNTAYDFIVPSAPNLNGSQEMAQTDASSQVDSERPYNKDNENVVLRGDFPMPDTAVRKFSGYEFGTFGNSDNSQNQRRNMNNLPTPTISPVESNGTSQSSFRNISSAKRAAQLSAASNAVSSGSTSQFRTRRSSLFPVTANIHTPSRQPRKSIGPGMISGATERSVLVPSARPTMSSAANAANMKLNHEISKARARLSPSGPGGGTRIENVAPPAPERRPRVQSLQASSHRLANKHSEGLSSHLETGKQSNSSPRNAGRQLNQRTTTPSSSARQSIYNSQNSHMGGLGARTVSPTDTRRMRRLSTVNIGRQPNAPTPDGPSNTTSLKESVPPVPQNQMTSALSVDTPDLSRGLTDRPISSRSSYSSCRPISSSQMRLTMNAPAKSPITSASPVKSPLENEIVPPVPAIPKGYGSNNDQLDHNLFSNDIAQEGKGHRETERVQDISSVRTSWRDGRQKRGMIIGSLPDTGKQSLEQKRNRSSQPMRLPPLNIVPLDGFTTSRPLPESRKSPVQINGEITPPPRRSTLRTPVTPMTASKATFPTSTFSYGDLLGSLPFLRSTTSHEEPWTRSESKEDPAESSPSKEKDSSPDISQSSYSPIVSSSIQTQNIEASFSKTKEIDANCDIPDDTRSSRFSTFRNQFSSKSSRDSRLTQGANTSQIDQSPAPPPLRRKMSLGWRRSSSKASHGDQQNEDELGLQLPKTSDMHPPKIELSASTKEQIRLSSIFNQGFSDKSVTPNISTSALENNTKESDDREEIYKKGRTPESEVSLARDRGLKLAKNTRDSSTSAFADSSLQSTGQNARIPRPDSKIDRDDQAADDEMKRLASRRKDFEVAAREFDDLKRRANPKERLSPSQAARVANLNIFERGEVIDYKEIYFCGNKTAKKFVGDLNAQASNFGFDDERGDYNLVMGDHLAYRYEVVDMLGKGSFGQVVRCIDHKSGKLVAIKIIRNKKRFHQQALVEVNILQKLREWDPHCRHSMINFTQSFYFRGHLCISTELLGMNLYELIKAHDFRGFSLRIIRRFTKQLLSSLVLLQSRRVIHCDLKPENILLVHPLQTEIKVIDFGSSCFENEKVYTYIQSRFYRSPEVILGMSYGLPIDMWSVGCILAELLTGYPIFPGENEQEQLACIMEVFGPPEKHLIEKSTRKKLFFDSLGKPRVTVSSKGKRRRPSSKTLQQALKCDDEAFLDFITRCLRWDPDRRLKPDDAMNHAFVTGIRKPSRPRQSGASSPTKRTGLAPTPSRPRPLPEPPASGFKSGAASSSLSIAQPSPTKGSTGRRHSTVNGLTNLSSSKKPSSAGAAAGLLTGLPRATPRSASGRPDLASAAAIASLRHR